MMVDTSGRLAVFLFEFEGVGGTGCVTNLDKDGENVGETSGLAVIVSVSSMEGLLESETLFVTDDDALVSVIVGECENEGLVVSNFVTDLESLTA